MWLHDSTSTSRQGTNHCVCMKHHVLETKPFQSSSVVCYSDKNEGGEKRKCIQRIQTCTILIVMLHYFLAVYKANNQSVVDLKVQIPFLIHSNSMCRQTTAKLVDQTQSPMLHSSGVRVNYSNTFTCSKDCSSSKIIHTTDLVSST